MVSRNCEALDRSLLAGGRRDERGVSATLGERLGETRRCGGGLADTVSLGGRTNSLSVTMAFFVHGRNGVVKPTGIGCLETPSGPFSGLQSIRCLLLLPG